jgi:predicted ATPase
MLFGRAAELGLAEKALGQVAAGRGTVLVLTGEPGIRKSTLARAIADAAEARGTRVAVGRAWEETVRTGTYCSSRPV